GPLRDLNKLDFGGTIAEGIRKSEGLVVRATDRMAGGLSDRMSVQVGASMTGTAGSNANSTIGLLNKLVNKEQVIVLDTGELVGGTYNTYDRVGGSRLELSERWGR